MPSQLLSHSEPGKPGHTWLLRVVSLPLGMKAGARPGGPPGAPASQPGAEGESVFSKILPGGAAEQAGKLTEGEPCLWPGPQVGSHPRALLWQRLGVGSDSRLSHSGPGQPCGPGAGLGLMGHVTPMRRVSGSVP